MVKVAPEEERHVWPYLLWSCVGALLGLGVVGILSIGVFALGVALLLALVGRGADPMQVIAVRLTSEEIAALDAFAAREHLSRSEAIRRVLAGYAA